MTAVSSERLSCRAPVALLIAWLLVTMLLWGMAFFRLPDSTPEWLLRAQAICFGSHEDGLPDSYGWMLLILSPLLFLVAIWIADGERLKVGIGNLLRHPAGKLLAVLLFAASAAEASWVATRIAEGLEVRNTEYGYTTAEKLPEHYPMQNRPAPEFSLVDQNGNTISPEALEGRVTFLTFAFAHCKTICPAIVKSAQNAKQAAPALPISLAVVTLDPWRDTPASLLHQATKWDFAAHEHFLSQSVEEVSATLDAYQVPRERNLKDGDISHPALVYVIGPHGNIRYTFNNPYPSWLTEAAHRIHSAS